MDVRSFFDAFLEPFIVSCCVIWIVCFLIGKERINILFDRFKFEKYENKYYRKKCLKKSRNEKKLVYLPISTVEELIVKDILKKPFILLILVLFVIYTVYRMSLFISTFNPLHWCYNTSSVMLVSVHKYVLAEIWTYFPDDSFEVLCDRIMELGEDCPYSREKNRVMLLSTICSTGLFASLLSGAIALFKHNKIKYIKKAVLVSIICILGIYLSSLNSYYEYQEEVRQVCYYVNADLRLKNEKFNSNNIDKYENELDNLKQSVEWTYRYRLSDISISFFDSSFSLNGLIRNIQNAVYNITRSQYGQKDSKTLNISTRKE